MKQQVARFLASVTLFEWSGILTYFYFSHRLTAFLHPSFRPMVLVTGFLLLLAAGCVLFGGGEEEAALDHDCDDSGCKQLHAKLTKGGLLAFLVLLLPIALAAKISPDRFGAVLIQNRGVAESLASAPGVIARLNHSSPAPVYVGVNVPPEQVSTPADEQTVDLPKGWVAPNAPDFSGYVSKNVPEDDYPSSDALRAKLRADSNVSMLDAQNLPRTAASNKAPLRALNERPGAITPLGKLEDVLGMAGSPLQEGGVASLKSGDDGVTKVMEVTDLLFAAQQPSLMDELRGVRVQCIGQVLSADGANFRLLRLLVLCCAADAQPLAVRIETKSKTGLAQMAWVKVIGKLSFAKKGNGRVPVVTAEKVSPIDQPDEPFIY